MPQLRIEINGGIHSLDGVRQQLAAGMDSVMVGRLARDDPFFFSRVDAELFGDADVAAASFI